MPIINALNTEHTPHAENQGLSWTKV